MSYVTSQIGNVNNGLQTYNIRLIYLSNPILCSEVATDTNHMQILYLRYAFIFSCQDFRHGNYECCSVYIRILIKLNIVLYCICKWILKILQFHAMRMVPRLYRTSLSDVGRYAAEVRAAARLAISCPPPAEGSAAPVPLVN